MLNVGIVGMGHIGKKHEKAIGLIKDISLIAHSDLSQDYDSYSGMLENPEIDIVSVCTPNAFHTAHSLEAIEAGKHVICEKPFALKRTDCEKVINASLQSGKFLFCVMQNRFSPVSRWLKEIMETKSLGDILMVNVSCYWNRDKRYYQEGSWKGKQQIDGGTLFTQFAHYVDTLYYLFGEVKVEHASFENFTHKDLIEFEDSGNFSFRLTEGALGNFQYSTAVWDINFESSMTIIGSKGTIKVGGQYMDKLIYCHGENLSSPILENNNNIQNLSQIYINAKDAIEGKQKVMTNALDGMKVVEIIEKVYSFK